MITVPPLYVFAFVSVSAPAPDFTSIVTLPPVLSWMAEFTTIAGVKVYVCALWFDVATLLSVTFVPLTAVTKVPAGIPVPLTIMPGEAAGAAVKASVVEPVTVPAAVPVPVAVVALAS